MSLMTLEDNKRKISRKRVEGYAAKENPLKLESWDQENAHPTPAKESKVNLESEQRPDRHMRRALEPARKRNEEDWRPQKRIIQSAPRNNRDLDAQKPRLDPKHRTMLNESGSEHFVPHIVTYEEKFKESNGTDIDVHMYGRRKHIAKNSKATEGRFIESYMQRSGENVDVKATKRDRDTGRREKYSNSADMLSEERMSSRKQPESSEISADSVSNLPLPNVERKYKNES